MPKQPQQPPHQATAPSASAAYEQYAAAMTDPEAFRAAKLAMAGSGTSMAQHFMQAQFGLNPLAAAKASASDWSQASGGSSARNNAIYADPAAGPSQGWSAPAQASPAPGAAGFAAPSGDSAPNNDVSGPVPGVRYCDPLPDARWPDGSEVCNRFHPQDPRWQWRPSFEGERPPWEPRRPDDPANQYDNYNTERDGGMAQAKEQKRVEQFSGRAKRELCGPQLRNYKIPLTAKGQLEKYGTTFTNLLQQLGSSSAAEVKTARLRLIAAIRQSPSHPYVAPDPFYAQCARLSPRRS